MIASETTQEKAAPPPPGATLSSSSVNAAAEYVAIDAIRPWPGNPRDNAEAIKSVARSIRRFGFGAPIIARRENGEIIAGHTRYLAAKRLRLDTVPVRYLDLSEKEAHVLALADNKLGEIASWDDDALAKVLSELQADDVELELGTGFSDATIEKLLGDQDDGLDDPPVEGGGAPKFTVMAVCKSEQEQGKLLTRLAQEGYKVRAFMS